MSSKVSVRHPATFSNTDIFFNVRREIGLSLLVREIYTNAEEQDASDMVVFSTNINKCSYICIAHNGKHFSSQEFLSSCLTPNTSGKDSGIQGSGMKLGMFLVEESDGAELIIHSRSEETSFTSKLEVVNGYYKTSNFNEFNTNVPKIFGKKYDNYNVFVFYKFQRKNFKVSAAGIFDSNILSLMSEMKRSGKIRVSYIPHSNKFEGSCRKRILKYSEALESFKIDESVINVEDVEIPGSDMKLNAKIRIEVFPCISERSPESLIDVRTGKFQNKNTVSNYTLFVNLSKELITSRLMDKNEVKKFERLYIDPIYCSFNCNTLLSSLGISYVKNYDFKDKIKNYRYVDDNVKRNAKHWKPIIKVNVDLLDHDSLKSKSIRGGLFPTFGGINEFFYSSNNVLIREIVESIFNKASSENESDEFISFKERLKEHFPFDKKQRMPIPEEILSSNDKTLYAFKKQDDGTYERLLYFRPGDLHRDVIIRHFDGSPVVCDFDWVSQGFNIIRNGDQYTIVIDELSKKQKDGSIIRIKKEDYKASLYYFPGKFCEVDLGRNRYRLLERHRDDKLTDKTTVGGSNREKNGQRFTDNRYFRGKPGEIVAYSPSRGILVNEEHKIVKRVIYINKDQHPDIFKKWCCICNKMCKITRKIANEDYKKLTIDFNSRFAGELQEMYDDPLSFFINSQLENIFEYDIDVQSLLSKIEKLG